MLDVIDEIWIPPYEGRAVYLRAGQELRLIDVEGKQVGDFVCFRADDPEEFVSPVHMRACLSRLRLKTGDFLYSNRRRPLMRLVEDRVGRHDFLFPACDRYRYEVDFGVKNHPNCRDNLLDALRAAGRPSGFLPDPINWFMHIAVDGDLDFRIEEPLSKPGDFVQLHALVDVVVAVATCSQDLVPVNGFRVTPLKMEIYSG